MQSAKIFRWDVRIVPLSDPTNLQYSLKEIEDSKKFNFTELQAFSSFDLNDLNFFVSDVLLPEYEDFEKIADKFIKDTGEFTTKDIKEEMRKSNIWILQKEANKFAKKYSQEKKLITEQVFLDEDKNKFYLLYKEDIKPDPNGMVLIL